MDATSETANPNFDILFQHLEAEGVESTDSQDERDEINELREIVLEIEDQDSVSFSASRPVEIFTFHNATVTFSE